MSAKHCHGLSSVTCRNYPDFDCVGNKNPENKQNRGHGKKYLEMHPEKKKWK